MASCLTLCFISLFVIVISIIRSTEGKYTQRGLKQYYENENILRRRYRRGTAYPSHKGLALAGNAIRRVLYRAEEIFTDGYNKVYVKPGGQKQCFADFHSVSPKAVKNLNENTVMGRVGNLEVTMKKKADNPVLILSQQHGSYSSQANPPLDYIVIYKE